MTMESKRRAWLIPAALIACSAVPVLAGAVRFVSLARGVEVTPENARFVAHATPVMVHVVATAVWCTLGALQFHQGLRRRAPGWHRAAGRILAPVGVLAALSGLWLTLFFPPAPYDGPLLVAIRLVVSVAMVGSIGLALVAIRQRDVARHCAWMIRAYALGLGAGTQVVTLMPWLLFESLQTPFGKALLMGAGWAINAAVAEWIVRGRPALFTRALATGGAR